MNYKENIFYKDAEKVANKLGYTIIGWRHWKKGELVFKSALASGYVDSFRNSIEATTGDSSFVKTWILEKIKEYKLKPSYKRTEKLLNKHGWTIIDWRVWKAGEYFVNNCDDDGEIVESKPRCIKLDRDGYCVQTWIVKEIEPQNSYSYVEVKKDLEEIQEKLMKTGMRLESVDFCNEEVIRLEFVSNEHI